MRNASENAVLIAALKREKVAAEDDMRGALHRAGNLADARGAGLVPRDKRECAVEAIEHIQAAVNHYDAVCATLAKLEEEAAHAD